MTRAFLDMRALQMQLAVLRKSIEVTQHYVDFVQERFNRGITNELDVTLAQRELGQLQSQVAPLIARIDAARYVIAVLVGDFPENLAKGLRKPGVLPTLPARIEPGLPIELLRRRPDVAEAERQLASATAQIGVATAGLFPQVVVTAGLGAQQGRGATPAVSIRSGRSVQPSPSHCWILAGSMPRSSRPTFAAASFYSTTSRRCSMRCARSIPPSAPTPPSRSVCGI